MTEFFRKILGVMVIDCFLFGTLMKRIPLFWDVKLCHCVIGFQCFERTYYLHHQGTKVKSCVPSKSLDLLTSDTALYPASTDSFATPP
jgi:hypothetical protein